MSGNRKIPRWVWVLVKLGIAASIVYWIISSSPIKLGDVKEAASNWPLLVLAAILVLIGIFFTAIRWGILLKAHGIILRTWDLFKLTMTGFFFTVIAPGGLGGDAVKAYLVAQGREKKTEAVTTVFLDRFIGMATMLLVAGLVLLFDFRHIWNAEIQGLKLFGMPGGRILVLAIGACIGGVVVVSLLLTSKRVRQSGILRRLSRYVPFRPTVARIYEAVHHYGNHPRALIVALAVSILAQIPQYLSYYLYGLALGVDIRLWHCALIVPPASAIRVIPIIPGGAGQGMVAMQLLFPLVGITKGAAIGALGDLMAILVYLCGGLFFIFGKTSYHDIKIAAAEVEDEAKA